MRYPYWVVISRKGRLGDVIPLKYRHTVIEKMLKSGKIGGTSSYEKRFQDFSNARDWGLQQLRYGVEVSFYIIDRANSPRRRLVKWQSSGSDGKT
jgi:hypothetical protein